MGAPILAVAAGLQASADDAEHDLVGSKSHVINRITKDNRRLWYCLKVIQQPERARACGSGPKSSADRRPVDPPPVVRLRIFEGATLEAAQAKDVTFQYNANFFLFATLEHARVIAHGRGPAPTPAPPILTGMPVSGMAYLDRPQEAGYFLFPDLSVRHEGRYRLTFNLYEETKEDRDKGIDAPPVPSFPSFSPVSPDSFDFRMEVKSQDFVVYSAKKFPGLAESTGLSKAIAEQGCRVRIRRDVRMRRRDVKGSGAAAAAAAAASAAGASAAAEAGEQYRRRRATATPDAQTDNFRARSLSGSTERTPYHGDTSRRPSMTDYAPHPPQFSGPSQPVSAGGHLQFLSSSSSSSNPQFPAHPQSQSFPQPTSVPPSPVYPPSQASYQPQTPYSTAPATPSYGPDSRGAQSYPSAAACTTPTSAAQVRRDSAPREYRESISSASDMSLPPFNLVAQSGSSSPFLVNSQIPAGGRKTLTALPPLQVDPSLMARPVSVSGSWSSLVSPTLTGLSRSCLSGGVLPPPTSRALPAVHAGTKRSRDMRPCRDPDLNRFHNGARDTASEDEEEEQHLMIYKRADGKVELANASLGHH